MRLLITAFLLAQQAPVPTEGDKMEAGLKKFGDRTYELRQEGRKVGSVSLRTRVEKGKGGKPVAVFEDEIKYGDGNSSFKMKETASLDRLRVLSAERMSQEGKDDEPWTLTVDGKKAKIVTTGRETTLDISDSAVSEHGRVRLVCIAEQKVGVSFKVDVLSLRFEEFQPGHAFTCVAKERIEIDGKKVDAFKWENKGEWKETMVDETVWVSPDGFLLKSRSPRGDEVVLVTAK